MEPSAESDSSTREGSAEEGEIQELRQKLTMAMEEVETVRADLTMQLHQTRQMAEATKEESEERGQEVLQLSQELEQQAKTIAELEETVDRQKKEWMEELEAVRMRMELGEARRSSPTAGRSSVSERQGAREVSVRTRAGRARAGDGGRQEGPTCRGSWNYRS